MIHDDPAGSKSVPITYSQPDRRFTGPSSDYIRASDEVRTYGEIADTDHPLCKVEVFQPGSRFTYYVAAVTDYNGLLVLSGFCVSPLDPAYDALQDASLEEIAAVRVLGVAPERDLYFTAPPLSEVRARVAGGEVR